MKEYFVTEELSDKTIVLHVMGSEVYGRVWCVGRKKEDLTHRMRQYDGFYYVSNLKRY